MSFVELCRLQELDVLISIAWPRGIEAAAELAPPHPTASGEELVIRLTAFCDRASALPWLAWAGFTEINRAMPYPWIDEASGLPCDFVAIELAHPQLSASVWISLPAQCALSTAVPLGTSWN